VTDPAVTADAELAARHQPILRLDRNEPYAPVLVGYTVFRQPGASPSSKFAIEPIGSATIEYAVYYDWDIGHLYDLEHVWVHVAADGAVIAVEASAHGRREPMVVQPGLPEMDGPRPVLYVEPGKHAHWADPQVMRERAGEMLGLQCGDLAGHEGVHRGNPFYAAGSYEFSALHDRLARLKMQGVRFIPRFEFPPPTGEPTLLPWAEAADAIAARVNALLGRLEAEVPHLRAILLDCGDTLVDEGTEVKPAGSEVVISGELIAGARETIAALKTRGYSLILVADGPRETFQNLLGQHGLWDAFDGHVISGDVGALKPSARMFDAALAAAGLARADARQTVMVGNNLSRDIRGANALGINSIFFSWTDRRVRIPADAAETPDFIITALAQLPALLDRIELTLPYRAPGFVDFRTEAAS
jgi:phosphoglycolate phosphatase-like HAD superfamily hydrolase